MRCDLHVHTRYSGRCTLPVLRRFCLESYTDPEAVYTLLKRRGMDLVTVTDHDSLEAAERLRRHADFFSSEEVTCRTPWNTELHVGVYGLSEGQHGEVQRRRDDLESFLAFLNEQGLLFSVNHAFSSLTGRRTASDFVLFQERFRLVETRNGQIPEANNRHAQDMADLCRAGAVAGSDAHTSHALGRTFTEVRGARTAEEFLAGLRAGQGIAWGESGTYWKLTRAVLSIGASMIHANVWTLPLALLSPAVPVVIACNHLAERWFARRWRHAARTLALTPGEARNAAASAGATG
jgi:predicted metal-dependent phosphoesterase TrpH